MITSVHVVKNYKLRLIKYFIACVGTLGRHNMHPFHKVIHFSEAWQTVYDTKGKIYIQNQSTHMKLKYLQETLGGWVKHLTVQLRKCFWKKKTQSFCYSALHTTNGAIAYFSYSPAHLLHHCDVSQSKVQNRRSKHMSELWKHVRSLLTCVFQ